MGLIIEKNIIEAGAEKEFKILHITDTHLCFSYESEGEEKVNLAKRRLRNAFGGEGTPEKYLLEAIEYAKKNDDLIAYTGDIYDYLSQANLDYFKKVLAEMDYIYAAGNHDYCTYPGRDKEDYDFKMNQIKLIAPYVKYNLMFDSRVINGVNLVMVENSYYQFTHSQLELLKCEVAKGYPVILFFHNPIYTKELAEEKMKDHDCAYVCAPTEELISRYPKERGEYQRANEETKEFIDYISSEKKILCLITGHLHTNHITSLESGLVQYVTGGTFDGYVREFIIR